MPGGDELPTARRSVDLHARPRWFRTGYRYFPYAAREAGRWWVLRLNYDFPAHDQYTVFVDGTTGADITGEPGHRTPLVDNLGSLKPFHDVVDEPRLAPDLAAPVVHTVAQYADYGSEDGDACVYCSGNDGMERT